MNNDGVSDVLVANAGGRNVSELLGNGNGTFQPQRTFYSGAATEAVVASDLNGDGKSDMVVAAEMDHTIGVMIGNGTGTFAARATFAPSANPDKVAVADVNMDGRPDLISIDALGNTADVMLQSGNGDFIGQAYTISPIASPPVVTSITRAAPTSPTTNATSVSYTVSFSAAVTGVDSTDFRIVTSGGVGISGTLGVSGSGASYTVTVNGIHGSGAVQLELVDNDSITASGMPHGGAGTGNGSFFGQTYTILQAFPTVMSINRANPAGSLANTTSVSYTVTFSEPVTGVDSSDFALALSGVTATTPVAVSGSGTSYTVTISGISGFGTLGLNLIDNGTIHDAAGNPLQSSTLSPGAQQTYSTGFATVSGFHCCDRHQRRRQSGYRRCP